MHERKRPRMGLNTELLDLCDDVLGVICGNLEMADLMQFRRVCKRFLAVSKQTFVQLDLSSLRNVKSSVNVAVLFPHATTLKIANDAGFSDDDAKKVFQNIPHLEQIFVSGSNITEMGILNISQHGLQSLDLSFCLKFSDISARILSCQCPNLTSVALSGCKNLTDDGLLALAKNCQNLRALDVSCCSVMTEHTSKEICQHLTALQELQIDYTLATDTSLYHVATNCPNIEWLSLQGTRITTKSLDVLSKFSQKLRRLSVANCQCICDVEGLKFPSSLRSADFSGCIGLADSFLVKLAEQCPNLESLQLWLVPVGDKGICAVAYRCIHVQQLDLRCTFIGDSSLEAIAANCHGLRRLNVSSCLQITTRGIRTVLHKCQQLEKVIVRWLPMLRQEKLKMPSRVMLSI